MDSTELWLRLMTVTGLSGEKMLKAAGLYHSGVGISAALQRAGIAEKQQKQFFSVTHKDLTFSQRWLDAPHRYLISADMAWYPPLLRAISWFPGALFVWGDPEALVTPQLAVVGSRSHSWYGKRWGHYFSYLMAKHGLTISSGLALGIDGIAHRAALEASCNTVAVLGNGLGDIYPRRHKALAHQIIEMGGAIVSEFPLLTPPWPGNFTRRNRIISGLSRGVLVVEAGLRSGSLVTARYAIEQGRDVFALPGAIGSPGSEGPHWLIKQGAIPVTSPEDIIEHLGNIPGLPPLTSETNNSFVELEEAPLPFPHLLANVGDEVTPVDVVAERAGQPVPLTVAQLLELELAGWIAAVPGGYVRLRRASHVRRTNVFI